MEHYKNNLVQKNYQETIFEFFPLYRNYLEILKKEELKYIENEFKKTIIHNNIEKYIEDREGELVILKNDLLSDIILKEKLKISKDIASKILKYFIKIKNNPQKLNLVVYKLKSLLNDENLDFEKLKGFLVFCELDTSILGTKAKVEQLLEAA